MADRIPIKNQHAATAARLLTLLRLCTASSVRAGASASATSTSNHILSSSTYLTPCASASSLPLLQHTRCFSSSVSTSVSAHRKQAGREKARLRSMRTEEKILRRREKDGYSANARTPHRPKDPIEEDVEFNIRDYMARTGPRGERLTLAQQERLLNHELRGLGHELERLEKKAKSDEATKDLPELDDHTLDELYQALMLPPPPTPEEARLARLEGGRKEKSLLERGRRGLERLNAGVATLPPSVAEKRKARTSMDLKQKLIAAREKARMMLPPSTSSSIKSRVEEVQEVELHRGDEEIGEQPVDMAALPYAERQEIRLQQLFARLALVHSSPGTLAVESGTESLQEIKSSLATRIAKILQEHNYELHPSVQKQKQEQEVAQPAEEQAESALPPFKAVRLDGRAPALAANQGDELDQRTNLDSAQDRSDLVLRAESMIQDLSSRESRTFMLDGIESLVRSAILSSPASASETQPARLPLGVATVKEWTALAVSSARADDTATLSRTMSLMHVAGYHPAPLELYNDVIDVFASKGQVGTCQEWLAQMSEVGLVPDNHTYHSLTKAYMNSAQFLPALQLLNSLETDGRPASMTTYTMVIDRLIDPVPLSQSGKVVRESRPELQALAWNMFYHMRLHAHPVPDAPLYALMIRACARGIPQPTDIDDPSQSFTALSESSDSQGERKRISDAERALDLFREMTTRYSVRPNADVYNSLILAFARRKDFYLEAFRLLREMVELETERSHISDEENGEGVLRFAPDKYTFNALLQGCARNRDLARARWVLAEMIRTTLPLFDDELRGKLSRTAVVELLAKRPNEETMCHLFHTYASYVPPLKRYQLQVTLPRENPSSSVQPVNTASGPTESVDPATNTIADLVEAQPTFELENTQQEQEEGTSAEEAAQVFSALVPQTSSDLVSESRSLFARIHADQPRLSSTTILEGPLGGVTPGIRLVNAYLTVLAAHLPPQHRARVLHSTLATEASDSHDRDGQILEFGLFEKLGLKPNEHSFRIILEALADGPSSNTKIVESVWERFALFIAAKTDPARSIDLVKGDAKEEDKALDAVQVKKSWCAYMHFLAKTPTLPTITTPSTDVEEANEDGLDKAMRLLHTFVETYPPKIPIKKSKQAKKRQIAAIINNKSLPQPDLSPLPIPIKSLQSLHTLQTLPTPSILKDAQAETEMHQVQAENLRLSSSPSLTFLDTQLLHHRLVRYGRTKDLAYLSWVLHRYNAASR